ncbi:type 1 glutamine amidotransferase [Thalassospiraceae bacterium LMO-SO8]|nr:type 1 glutamine amidotransferase [Alphaproteobacteria bacterium LMO-S08]WND76139.1 type 1 glutamine amidotransferase [Thalassospiraceae bacterium LMO-SO8]
MTAPKLRILIIEGNTAAGNAAMAAAGVGTNADQYAAAVRRTQPDADIRFAHPADRTDALPPGAALSDFDGAILGGSGLFVRAQGNAPEVQRQVDLVRALFGAGVPMLGSCWGLQVAAVAAGGDVAPSPNGREVGICRAITLSDAGVGFPMFAGKPRTFDSLAIHYDEVTRLPTGAAVLAANGHSPIQAAAFTFEKGVFWGVQYHPEFSFPHMARLIRRYGADMVTQGIYPDQAAMDRETEAMLRLDTRVEGDKAHAAMPSADPGFSETVTDAAMRCREIDNWLQFCRSEKSG